MRTTIILCLLFFSIYSFSQEEYPQFGKASFYADKFVGKLTASGEKYKHSDMTAAHKSLPFGTKIKVTNLMNNKSVVVRVNDRGPYVKGRIIDVSKSAAKKLDFIDTGIVDVKIEIPGSQTATPKKTTYKPNTTQYTNTEYQYYEVDASVFVPKKYGVQIGSYSDSGNLLKTISDFKSKHSYKIIVQESVQNSQRKYRLVVGNFNTRIEAENLIKNLKSTFPDCFVLNLAN